MARRRDDWSEERAQHAEKFIETLCSHTKGKWAGLPFRLIDSGGLWQRGMVRELFGRMRPGSEPDTLRRQYRMCYVEVPKKNGKSELAAAIALKCLVADGEEGAEVYSAAGDLNQAAIVYRVAAQMVRNSPVLSRRLKVLDSTKRIIDYRTGSYYQVLSRDSYTKHGYNPSAVIFDELHAQKDRELWDVLTEGTDYAREQQLVFAITTAGIWDPQSICWEVREHARQVAEGAIEDPSLLPVLYTAPKDADWEDEELWRKCNPSLGHIFDLGHVRDDYERVKENPARQNNFRRFRLCQWVNQIDRYIPMEDWDASGEKHGPVREGDLLKRPCFGALDLSSTTDLTAFLLVFPPDDPTDEEAAWPVLAKAYVPEDTIRERSKRDRVPYDLWARAGLLTATPGNVVDLGFIRRDVRNAARLYDLREVAYDPWRAVQLASQLADEDGVPMIEHRQGFKSMSNPTSDMLRLVKQRRIAHGGHPVLRWCMDNLVVRMDPAENVKPEKGKATERIDLAVALIMALGRALAHQPKKESVYNERGVVLI